MFGNVAKMTRPEVTTQQGQFVVCLKCWFQVFVFNNQNLYPNQFSHARDQMWPL